MNVEQNQPINHWARETFQNVLKAKGFDLMNLLVTGYVAGDPTNKVVLLDVVPIFL